LIVNSKRLIMKIFLLALLSLVIVSKSASPVTVGLFSESY